MPFDEIRAHFRSPAGIELPTLDLLDAIIVMHFRAGKAKLATYIDNLQSSKVL